MTTETLAALMAKELPYMSEDRRRDLCEKFAALVAEDCAKVADEICDNHDRGDNPGRSLGVAIRSRYGINPPLGGNGDAG